MDISAFTGTKEPLDNWTSLYTFALGLIAGGFVAIGIGEVDMAAGLRGDLLRIYLAVITAVLAFGGALFVSRLGDRIADNRATWRRTYAARRRIKALIAALKNLYEIFEHDTTTPKKLQRTAFEVFLKRLAAAAGDMPDFDELIESDADQKAADEAIDWFRHYAGYTAPLIESEGLQRDFLFDHALRPERLADHRGAAADLIKIVTHFETKVGHR
jgi:hypothetical protein